MPSSTPNLLVVTPTLGDSPWLEATVASVGRLPVALTHVLVAPAGRVGELARRFPAARVLPEPGGGMYAAINAGVSAVSDWSLLTYVNDDDLLLPRCAAAAAAAAGPAATIAYGRVRLIGAGGARLGVIPVSPWPALNRALYAQRLEPVYQHGTVINRAAWDRLGGFDAALRYCGDSELLARATLAGVTFRRVWGGPVAAFRLRGGQLTKDRRAMQEERRCVDAKLALEVPRTTLRGAFARVVFRVANLAAYAERTVRFGPVPFDDVLARGE